MCQQRALHLQQQLGSPRGGFGAVGARGAAGAIKDAACPQHQGPEAPRTHHQTPWCKQHREQSWWLQQTAGQVAGRCLSAISLGVRICEDAAGIPVAQGGGLRC